MALEDIKFYTCSFSIYLTKKCTRLLHIAVIFLLFMIHMAGVLDAHLVWPFKSTSHMYVKFFKMQFPPRFWVNQIFVAYMTAWNFIARREWAWWFGWNRRENFHKCMRCCSCCQMFFFRSSLTLCLIGAHCSHTDRR